MTNIALIKKILTKETISKKSRITRILENQAYILEETLKTLKTQDLVCIIEHLSSISTNGAFEFKQEDYLVLPNHLLIEIIFSFFNNSKRKLQRDLSCIIRLPSFNLDNFIDILLLWNNMLIKDLNSADIPKIFAELTTYKIELEELEKSDFSSLACKNLLEFQSKTFTKYSNLCKISNISKFICRRDNLKFCIIRYFIQKNLAKEKLREEVMYQHDYINRFMQELELIPTNIFPIGLLITDICDKNHRYLNSLI